MGGWALKLNDEQFIIEYLNCMESDYDSKGSIDSIATKYIGLSLKTEPQIVKNLQNLIDNEIELQLNFLNSTLNERLKSAYQQSLMHLKVDLRRVQRSRLETTSDSETMTGQEDRIKEHINKIISLKQISIYFTKLKKESTNLEKDVEKFMFYTPQSEKLEEKLEAFFSSSLVSQLFLKEYEKSFNTNNFSADLIDFFFFLHQNNLLQLPQPQVYQPARNKDLDLIENSNIIFRQVCDINDKYAHVEHQLQEALVHMKFIKAQQHYQDENKSKYKIEEGIIDNKFQCLKTVCNKIKHIYGGIQFNNFGMFSQTIIVPEQPETFSLLDQHFQFPMNTRNESFLNFLQNLYDPKLILGIQDPGAAPQFDFLRNKIIKAQTRWHLNRLISAFNIGSHIINQLQTKLNLTYHSYSFSSPWVLSKYQFNSKRINFFTSKPATLQQLLLLNKNVLISKKDDSYVLRIGDKRLIYPSTINNYFYFLKYLYNLSSILQANNIYSLELILEIIEIKADEMMEWAEIAINLYEIIKSKYYRSYEVLQKYLFLVFQLTYHQQLDVLSKNLKEGKEGVSLILQKFISKERKAGCISQIIFEFEVNYDIRECLLKLYEIQLMNKRTFYCIDTPFFYEKILNEIIETKNNLKFDKCLSFTSLHQMFGFMSARPNNLKDLAAQLTPLSKQHLRLPDLLRFYASQTRLKREVFKAELYWITIAQPSVRNKFIIISQKKKPSFKDFLDQNAKNILALTQKPLPYFLSNLQEFQRSIYLFGQQVQRLKLIQSLNILLKPQFPLQDHVSAFSYKQLVAFFTYCSNFNVVEDLFIRRQKNNWILGNIKKFIENGKLKYGDICLEPSLIPLKNQLAGYISLIYAFEHHYTYEDYRNIYQKIVKESQPSEYALKLQILRSKRDILKEFQQCQFMDYPCLCQFTLIYEHLILISIIRLIRRRQLEPKDIYIFNLIKEQIPLYQSFKAIDIFDNLECIKSYSGTSSRVNIRCGLRNILIFYKQSRDRHKKIDYQFKYFEVLGLMTQLDIVARRRFCNEIIELKRLVAAQQWKNFNKTTCLNNLKLELDKEFIAQLNQFISKNLHGAEMLNEALPTSENIQILNDLFKRQILIQFDEKYEIQDVKKKPIVLFDEFRGYQVEHRRSTSAKAQIKKNVKKHRNNFKRGILNAIKREDQGSTQIINNLQHRINLEIVKESLPIRKLIYQLQLQQKKIRDEISWETCKLQHNVITKINKFIEESNLDQKQSLINFKYTVNLQTIKGIENVIHERTQIFNKNSQQKLHQQTTVGFMTQPTENNPSKTKQQQQSLLDINVKNIFNHVKKLKIFWAWKNIHFQRQSSDGQWIKFSDNVQKILHNKQNMKTAEQVTHLRVDCNKYQIICNLIKQQNVILNGSIKKMKINTLTKKLNTFKQKYRLHQQPQQ